jgi:predicted nuclease with TOPRIM domain
MEFDQQLESMASKLAQDFMTYFKRMYGTPSLLEDLRTRLGELGNWRQHANTKFDSLKARIKGLETSEKSVLGRIKILETASLDMVNQKFEEQADVNLDFESRLLKVEKRAHDVPEEFVRRTREATKVVDRVKLLESQVANARVGKLEGFFGDHEAMARRHQHVQATTSGVYARIEKLEEDNTLLHETLTKMRQDHVALQNRINRFEDQDEVQAWMDASDNPVLAVAQDVEKLKSKTKVLDSMGHQTTTLHQRLRKLEDRLEDYSDGDAERAFESINMLVERVEKLEGQVIGKVQASGIAQRIEVKLDKVLEIVDQLGEA